MGLDSEGQGIILFLLTPPMAMAILLFRGHLFASLHGSSRRQRLFSHQLAPGSRAERQDRLSPRVFHYMCAGTSLRHSWVVDSSWLVVRAEIVYGLAYT